MSICRFFIVFTLLFCVTTASTQETRYESLADTPFTHGYPSQEDVAKLKDELFFQRGVQAYIWTLSAMNMQAMKECFATTFGEGYNVMVIWKDRLNSRTKMLTPNSDVIYGIAFLDTKKDGPMVVEAPPGMQGVFDDWFQRPISTEKPIDGKMWTGDIGLPGPDKGKGGKYLIVPPDWTPSLGENLDEYFIYRSKTYNVFVLWRGFFHDPKQLDVPVKNMEKTKIYPLGKEASAKPMQFPNASVVETDMSIPKNDKAFEMIHRIIEHEFVDPQDMELRGMLAAIGIIKGMPFKPTEKQAKLLDQAAKTAAKYGLVVSYTPQEIEEKSVWYKDRRWLNAFPGNATFTADSFNYIDPRTGFFTNAISTSPGMAITMEKVGAKYPCTFVDADGKFLSGSNTYKLHLPKDVPAAIFWSVTAYDSMEATLLDNGELYSSINTMDKPIPNDDGSFDVYLGPKSPGDGKNWIKTVPEKGFFVILRLYGPTKPFFDQTWKPSDLHKQ